MFGLPKHKPLPEPMSWPWPDTRDELRLRSALRLEITTLLIKELHVDSPVSPHDSGYCDGIEKAISIVDGVLRWDGDAG